jgi:hypothetical protein
LSGTTDKGATTVDDFTDATEAERLEAIRALGLTIDATFVPWSKSRKSDEKEPSLNWSIALQSDSRMFRRVDYTAGIAHAPSYGEATPKGRFGCRNQDWRTALEFECEKGARAGMIALGVFAHAYDKAPIAPSEVSVWYSIVMDSDAIEHATFEDWADSFGYDRDSRKGEAIYRECLAIGLALRSALGEERLAKLRNIVQGY